jgi:uncharacterized glyoxalase superfamily protein PhnB
MRYGTDMPHIFRVIVPGVDPLGQIADRPWGERSFYVADPFGNPVCFVSRETVFTG